MDEKQKETRLNLWEQYRAASYRRWRVYSTFLTGLAIGFIFVVILSNTPDNATVFDDYINSETLVLLFSGILGGVIYTILIDGHVEMPRFVANKGDKFEAGLFGDILLGIAGSVVAYFLLSGTPLFEEGGDNATIKLAAIGIIGGYGGRAILQFALTRMFSDINVLEEDRQKYLKVAYQQRAEAQEGLKIIDQLNQHIQTGLSNSELVELTVAIRQAPASVRKQVFELAKDFRQTASLSDVAKPRIARTIPIFEALTEVEPDNYRYYAQLAYAYKDSGSPDLLKAIQYLDRAIELRGDQHQAETWKYELCRAITRIQQEHKNKGTYDFDTAVNDRIIADLLAVARIYNLENILKAAEERNIPVPVWEWAKHNRSILETRKETQSLMSNLTRSGSFFEPSVMDGKDTSGEAVEKARTKVKPIKTATVPQQKPEATKTEVVPTVLPQLSLKPELVRWREAIANAKPKGASVTTSGQDGLSYSGVKASQKMAETDWQRIKPFGDRLWVAAKKFLLPPELLAAIASRESRGGNPHLLDNGWGDHGNAFGLMQVDKNYHTIQGAGSDVGSQEHINQGTAILKDYLNQVKAKCPSWNHSQLLEGAAVAYNSGVDNVRTLSGMNDGTTGDDYGADVIARAQYYAKYFTSPIIINEKSAKAQIFFPSSEISSILQGVNGTFTFPDWDSDIKIAVRTCLVALDFMEDSDKTDDDLLMGWGRFKKSVYLAGFNKIGYESAQKLLEACEQKSSSSTIHTDAGLTHKVSLDISGSVGAGGMNKTKDVLAVKERLASLGFSFFTISNKKDQGLVDAINLFQSIIHGRTNRAGDGRIDVDGKTHTYLRSPDAPRWIELPIEGPGFVNHERKNQSWDDHDYGTNWISDVIYKAGKHYEENYRKGKSSIALIAINDVSRPEGGFTKDHSGHECGNACDLLLPHKGGGFGSNKWSSSNYDQSATRAQLQALKAQNLVTTIYFNDPTLQKEGLCSYCGGHDDHIHFEIGVIDT